MELGVVRDGKHQNFKVLVGDLAQVFPEDFGGPEQPGTEKPEGSAVSFGMSITNLTPQRRQTLGLKQGGGVLISSVEPNSFADDIGLAPNDILTSINRHTVNTVDDVTRLRSTLKPGDAVQLQVLRKDQGRNGEWTQQFVAGILPSNPK